MIRADTSDSQDSEVHL